MKAKLLVVAALVAAGSLAVTAAFTQDAPRKEQTKPADAAASTTVEKAKPMRVAAVHRTPRVDPKDGNQISPYSVAERTANAKKDCAPGTGVHGVYRGYSQWDTELKSEAGRKLFEACIKRGLEPAPWFAVHRLAYGMGAKTLFGKSKEDCLKCHSKGY